MKGGHQCPVYDHLLRKGLSLLNYYLSFDCILKYGTLSLKWASEIINSHDT